MGPGHGAGGFHLPRAVAGTRGPVGAAVVGWSVDGWATRLEAWASVGGLVLAALGVWLDGRTRPPDAAFNRDLVVVLLALLLRWCSVGVAFLGSGS